MFCIQGYNVQLMCLCLIVKYVTRATFNRGRCSIQCHYSCLCFNNTKSNGIRNIIIQQDKSPHAQLPVPAILVAKFAFCRTECPICGGQTDHLELELWVE